LKKRYLNSIISFLIIFCVVSVIQLFESQKRQTQLTQITTTVLIQSLSETETCFGLDYTKMDEETKIINYIKASSNLHTAINILPYTSYTNVRNQELAAALNELYQTISSKSTNRWIAVTEKRKAIFDCLHYIKLNPNDKNSSNTLYKIAKQIPLENHLTSK